MAYARDVQDPAVSAINITPLVDVLLVLLVIFMISAPIIGRPLLLGLPQVGPTPPRPPEVLDLALDAEGRWLWRGAALPVGTVVGLLQVEAGRIPQPVLQLSAHPDVDYASWVRLLAASRQAGFVNVALAAD